MPSFSEIRNFQGGLADSDYRGISGSFGVDSYGLDIHDKSGLLKANWALTKDSGATVTDLPIHSIASSDGSTYWFGDAGEIYKRTSGGTWSNPRSEGERICGAAEYNGYFLWAEDNKLYRMLIGGNWTDGAMEVWNESGSAWSATLTNVTWTGTEVDTSWHVMSKLGVELYVAAGQYVTLVDSSFAVQVQGLDLPPDWKVIAMETWNDNLLIGAYNTTKDQSSIFVWDGFSASWSTEIPVPEDKIHSIVSDGQIAFIRAGNAGNIYQFLGNAVQLVKQIPGSYTASATEITYPDAMALRNGKVLIGVSNDSGNPCNQGVYTYGSPSINYPRVLDLSYIGSAGNLTTMKFGSLLIDGGDTFVSFYDGTNYGVDKQDFTTRFNNAIYTTTIIGGNKPAAMLERFAANFVKLPASCSITVEYRKNGDTSWTSLSSTSTTDDTNLLTSLPIKFQTLQLRVTLGCNSTDTPSINSLVMQLDRPNILS